MIEALVIGCRQQALMDFAVTRSSFLRLLSRPMRVMGFDIDAQSRFQAPFMAGWGEGWCLYVEAPALLLRPLEGLERVLDDRLAVMSRAGVMAFNLAHSANGGLTKQRLDAGEDLDNQPWLSAALIGTLPPIWGWRPADEREPDGSPGLACFNRAPIGEQPLATEWERELKLWIAGDYRADGLMH